MKTKSEEQLLAYFGHHKAASTWIKSIVVNVCNDMGWKTAYVSNAKMFNFNLKEFIAQEQVDFLCYANADFKYVRHLDNFKGFHVIRDPRDLIISAYFSHLHSHRITEEWPELREHRRQLEKLSKNEGLLLEMQFSKRFLEEMHNWHYTLPNVMEIKMEDLVSDPYKNFLEIFRFLGVINEPNPGLKAYLSQSIMIAVNQLHKRKNLPFRVPMDKVPAERLLGIVCQNDFYRHSRGRKSGEEDVKSHYRKGVAGDWRNHFNQEHIEFFIKNYNALILKLGYESNPRWWEEIGYENSASKKDTRGQAIDLR